MTSQAAEHPKAASIEKATGTPLTEWQRRIDDAGGTTLSHTENARWVHDQGVPSRWSQAVTVSYEQLIGWRQIAQTCTGDFAASASKTLPGGKAVLGVDHSGLGSQEQRDKLKAQGRAALADFAAQAVSAAAPASGRAASSGRSAAAPATCTAQKETR